MAMRPILRDLFGGALQKGRAVRKVSPVGLRYLSKQASELGKGSRLDRLKSYARDYWKSLDQRGKFTVFEMVGKTALLGFSGGWGLTIANSVINRVDRVEKNNKKMDKAVKALKVEMAELEDRARLHRVEVDEKYEKHRVEVDEKYEKLRLEFSQVKTFKDLWIAQQFKSSKVEEATPTTPS